MPPFRVFSRDVVGGGNWFCGERKCEEYPQKNNEICYCLGEEIQNLGGKFPPPKGPEKNTATLSDPCLHPRPKRGREKPRKAPATMPSSTAAGDAPTPLKRGRGRPLKTPAVPDSQPESNTNLSGQKHPKVHPQKQILHLHIGAIHKQASQPTNQPAYHCHHYQRDLKCLVAHL